MSAAPAFAKINLALVVGGTRRDGKHEVVTVLQRIDLHDTVTVHPSEMLEVEGFPEDTIVREALESLAAEAGVDPRWRVHIQKRIPVAAGLGGGSSDAATALLLANTSLDEPLTDEQLHAVAAAVGADVPFFLGRGAQLATGDGTELEEITVPTDYWVVLVVPAGETKTSTGDVYAAFDERDDGAGFGERGAALVDALALVRAQRDLDALPRNDLASSPLSAELEAAGAFRADVSGAGPTVYGLFEDHESAVHAADALSRSGQTFVTRPVAAGDHP